MSNKDVKKLLMEARDAIKNKNFAHAQKISQEAISIDKVNYNAWVFLGVASLELKELDKSVSAFNTAIEFAPNQPLAWQGLRSYYEKETPLVHVDELLNVYVKLLEFPTPDGKKILGTYNNIALLYWKYKKDVAKAMEYFTKAFKEYGYYLNSDNAPMWRALIQCLSSQSVLENKYFDMLVEAVSKILEGKRSGLPELEDCVFSDFEGYFELLWKAMDVDSVLSECKNMEQVFRTDAGITKWLLRCYIYFSMEKCPMELEDFEERCSTILDDSKHYDYVIMARGARAYLNNNLVEARNLLLRGVTSFNERNWESWLLLCEVLDKMRDGEVLERYAAQGVASFVGASNEKRRGEVGHRFSMNLGKSYYHQKNHEKWTASINIFEKIPCDSVLKLGAMYHAGLIHLHMENFEGASNVLKSIEDKHENSAYYAGLQGIIYAKKNMVGLAKERLESAVNLSPNNSDWLLELGLIDWNRDNIDAAYDLFLKAAKADRYNWKVFLMLGHYFRKTDGVRKAQRCYLQAYELSKADEEAGICLSDCYQELKEEDANMDLLTTATNNSTPGSCKWAWFRLGLLYLRKEDPHNAIRALQSALRADPLDRLCWECLAESYLVRGSNNAALKAFNKALELDSSLLYSQYQIASINLSLGLFKEAAGLFQKILDVMPLYVPALKGLGEAFTALALNYLNQSLGKVALSYCEAALTPLARALSQRPEFTCLWKLLGDACTLVAKIPEEEVSMVVPSSLVKGYPEEPKNYLTLDKRAVLAVGCRCYLAATRWEPNNSSLFHDIGVNCYYQALASGRPEEFSVYSEKSIVALKKAISLKPNQSHHWSALGVVVCSTEISNYCLAQHAFIKAVMAEPNNEIAWTNLGALYLMHDNVQLANSVFNVAQSIEPSYINCWVGQAQCAEKVDSKEAMDLFRHCTNLGHHLEGASGYATWVCSTLKDMSVHHTAEYKYNIEQMGAVSAAIDCLSQYTDMVKDDPCVYNMLGMLLERQSLFIESANCLNRGLKLLQNGGDFKQVDMLRCNYARVLRKLGNLKNSIEEAASVKESEFYNHCGLASSYNQLNMLEESVSTYQTALEWLANTEKEKSHLMVVMASMTYAIQGPEHAKTLLFQSFEMKPLCVQGVLALGALGILLSDVTLTNAALAELKPLYLDERYIEDIYYIRAWLSVIQGDHLAARNIICKAIHCWPSKWSFWKMLSIQLLQRHPTEVDSAIRCAISAAKICATPLLEILQLLSLCYALLGRYGEGLSVTKKLIHCYPGEKKNWLILTSLYKDHCPKLQTTFN